MRLNDYLVDAAYSLLRRSRADDQITHRMVVDQLIALKWMDAADEYLTRFEEHQLDSAAQEPVSA